MEQWEYKMLTLASPQFEDDAFRVCQQSLDRLGEQGWELVNAQYVIQKGWYFILKRKYDPRQFVQ
jgi:hypothetical protein